MHKLDANTIDLYNGLTHLQILLSGGDCPSHIPKDTEEQLYFIKFSSFLVRRVLIHQQNKAKDDFEQLALESFKSKFSISDAFQSKIRFSYY